MSRTTRIADTPCMVEAAAPLAFEGFPREAFAWFAGLEADNSKPYFTAHRGTYDIAVRGALEAMLDELAEELDGGVKMFRQNRDIRFSADKSPYKITTYGLVLRPDSPSGLYAQLSSSGLFVGTGYHMLAADQLARFRDAVVDDTTGPQLEQVVADVEGAGVETFGEALKTAPRGYPRDHPRVALLRHKSLVAGRRLPPGSKGIGRAAALDLARQTWDACVPLNTWLDRHVGPSELPVEPRYRRRAR
jgi:uncharacterized protein (TIGR02453 family)